MPASSRFLKVYLRKKETISIRRKTNKKPVWLKELVNPIDGFKGDRKINLMRE